MEIKQGVIEKYKKKEFEREVKLLKMKEEVEEGVLEEEVDELYYESEVEEKDYIRKESDIRLKMLCPKGKLKTYGVLELEPRGVGVELRYKKGKLESIEIENKLTGEKEKLESQKEIEGVKKKIELLERRGEVKIKGVLSKKGEGYIGVKREIKSALRKVRGLELIVDKVEGEDLMWGSRADEYEFIERIGYKGKEGKVIEIKTSTSVREIKREIESLKLEEKEYEQGSVKLSIEGKDLYMQLKLEGLREGVVKSIEEVGSDRRRFKVELEEGESFEVSDYGRLKVLNIKEKAKVRYVKGLGEVKVEKEGKLYKSK